jgi:hypothetical protein
MKTFKKEGRKRKKERIKRKIRPKVESIYTVQYIRNSSSNHNYKLSSECLFRLLDFIEVILEDIRGKIKWYTHCVVIAEYPMLRILYRKKFKAQKFRS